MKSSSFLFLLGILLVGCAKEKKYKEVYKGADTFSVASLSTDPNDPYVYVPSVENTPMNVTASRSYWLGDQKLVTFKFTERQLEVLELPADRKFAKNEANFSPVFKLDVEYKDFRCKKDQYGECSNEEEEVSDSSWDNKGFFKADFSKLTVLETNSLPEQLSNLFNKCFEDKGSVVKNIAMDSESMNITVEKTISAGIKCADVESFDDLRNLTFKVNYHYSFVKLSRLASQGYKSVVYPFTDQTTFGFFTTTTKKLSADNRTTINSDVTYMNRWNPERGQIVYYLNDGFYEEGKEKILKATYKAIDTINTSFSKAGVNLQIKLEDGRNKSIGDLRNNFLVMVTDPQASGVIGYGPTVAHPHTGEILKGQVVMYYGTIRKFIQETYDELVLEAQGKQAKAASEAAALESSMAKEGKTVAANQDLLERESAKMGMQKEMFNFLHIPQAQDVIRNISASPVRNSDILVSGKNLNEKLHSEVFSRDRMMKTVSVEDTVEEMSRNNVYHESMMNWNGALQAAIDDEVLDLKNAKPWNDLSDDDKEVLIEKLLPYVWVPTLVHEFGHNLGLRHNFNGSEDKANYYSHDERAHLGIDRNVTFSSVMDYSYTSLNQLPVMGKYDIAALRFGYNRELELKDGTLISMPTATLEELEKQSKDQTKQDAKVKSEDTLFGKLKDFKFCTDEHVSVNAACKRFDEGSSLKEIAQHYVNAYKKNYDKRNKRNFRLNFSSVSDASYYSSVRDTFHNLRLFFETYDRIKGMYPTLTDAQWESMEFLKDVKEATQIAANFYIEVLKTPSMHCALIEKKTQKLAGIIPLEKISTDALDCFDEDSLSYNTELYAVVAQTGKHFNHARGSALRGDLKADPSQMDIRGMWIDKLLAMQYLTKREMGISTFDSYRSNFLDHPEFQPKILGVFTDYLNGQISLSKEELSLEFASGEKLPFEHTFDLGDTHDIKQSYSSALNAHLKTLKPITDMRELIVPYVKRSFVTADSSTQTMGLHRSFSVLRVDPSTYVGDNYMEASFLDASGRMGLKYVADKGNLFAVKLLQNRLVRNKLEKMDRNKLIEIFMARNESKVPEVIPEELKDVYSMELPILLAYLRGELPEDSSIQKILEILSI